MNDIKHIIKANILNRIIVIVILFFVIGTSVAKSSNNTIPYNPTKGYGENFTSRSGNVSTHAVVQEFPNEGTPLYNVKVNNGYVGLYRDVNYWGGLVHFGSFEFKNGQEITILISYYQDIHSYEILPNKKLDFLKVEQTDHNCLRIVMNHANQNLTIIINGEAKKNVLHLFANNKETHTPNVPNKKGYHCLKDQKLHYFGAGFYDLQKLLRQDLLEVKDGWQVYIAPGAVVHGRVHLQNAHKGTKIFGQGMMYNDIKNPKSVFEADNCMGLDVEGVLFHTHLAQCWQVIVNHCQNIEFKNVKILSTRYASTDGLDVINSQQCTFLNTFIRSNDDAIAIKGLGDKPPAECQPNRNLTFCGMQLWNDCNNAMGIGAENHCSIYENIRFINSSILFSYDDPDYHEQLDERGAIGICCIHGTYFHNISYDNIDVYHCERLIAVGFHPDFWFGSLKGDQTTSGGMTDIIFRNINSPNNSGSRIANKIHLNGWNHNDTPSKNIDHIVFDNIFIEGKKINNTIDSHFSETDFSTVHNISFY